MTATPVKMVDRKGRVSLGKRFADHLVLIRQLADGVVQVELAEAVPAKEAWLHKNKAALAMVMKGLAAARAGKLVEGPDLKAAARLAKDIGD